MRKITMPRTIVDIFAIIGAIAALALIAAALLFTFMDTGGDTRIISSLLSPNNENIATTYSQMGGGAAGWCSIKVAINPASSPFSPENQNAQPYSDVYIGDCNISPELSWLSPTVLHITLPEFINTSWSSASVRGVSGSGAVTVQFNFTSNRALKAQPSASGTLQNDGT
ncbi:hypothetical protein [Lacimicrobium alkaliphilum]|nr:hypothetical protein [Lacimicrobium alkaliphilum]